MLVEGEQQPWGCLIHGSEQAVVCHHTVELGRVVIEESHGSFRGQLQVGKPNQSMEIGAALATLCTGLLLMPSVFAACGLFGCILPSFILKVLFSSCSGEGYTGCLKLTGELPASVHGHIYQYDRSIRTAHMLTDVCAAGGA